MNVWNEINSNQEMQVWLNTMMKKLSPKIILLIGSTQDKETYINYCKKIHAHNFTILQKEELLKVHNEHGEQFEDKDIIKKIIYNGDCQDFITNGKERV